MPVKPKPIEPGARFGLLTVIAEAEPEPYRCPDGTRRVRTVLCRCECGNERRVELRNAQRGRTRSCGCIRSQQARKAGLPRVWPNPTSPPGSVMAAAQQSGIDRFTIESRLRYGWSWERATSEPPRKRIVQRGV